jgi:hypothetical protein
LGAVLPDWPDPEELIFATSRSTEMKKALSLVLGVALMACAAVAIACQSPEAGLVLAMSGGVAMPQNVAEAFAQVFSPKVQFPRWFQPNPSIGQILVQNQDEEDELKARDWTPKPLPGSETVARPAYTMTDLQDAMAAVQAQSEALSRQAAAYAEERAVLLRSLEDQVAVDPSAGSGTDVPGGLADASGDDPENKA